MPKEKKSVNTKQPLTSLMDVKTISFSCSIKHDLKRTKESTVPACSTHISLLFSEYNTTEIEEKQS